MRTFVAPWVLPKEKMPVHLSWKEEKFDEIILDLPQSIIPADLFNVKEYSLENGKLIIKKLRTNDYFGMNLESLKIPEVTLTKIPFSIFFKKKKQVIEEIKLSGTVIRPKLEFLNVPNELDLTNTTDKNKFLNLELKHTGSGNITITISLSAGGKIISENENIFRLIWKKLSDGTYDEEENPNIVIDEKYLKELQKEFIIMLDNGMVPSGLSPESLKTIQEIVRDTGPEKFLKILTSTVQTFFMESFLEIADTYPSDHSSVRGGKTRATLKGTINKIDIKIDYIDTNNNSYESLVKTIKIKDNRTKPNPINIPLSLSIKSDFLKSLNGPLEGR
jgi:hypothetical protein